MKVYVAHVGHVEDFNLVVFSTWEKLKAWAARRGLPVEDREREEFEFEVAEAV